MHYNLVYLYIINMFYVKHYEVIVVQKSQRRETLVQTGLRLEAEILDRLRSGDRALSDEIRDRLQRTFKEDAIDPVTRELCAALLNLAATTRQDSGAEWHKSPYAFQQFTAALMQRLAEYRPAPAPDSEAVADLTEPPETVGRIRERDDRRAHPYPHLEAAQKRRGAHKLGTLRPKRAKKGGDNE
jgi:MoxR-like ATPase